MKFFSRSKDGGPESTVDAFWLIEWKRFFSIALLRFSEGSRDSYHEHAFDSISWLLRGRLIEHELLSHATGYSVGAWAYWPSTKPIVTRRSMFHRVISRGTSWVLTIRGPWAGRWREYDPVTGEITTLTHGRRLV